MECLLKGDYRGADRWNPRPCGPGPDGDEEPKKVHQTQTGKTLVFPLTASSSDAAFLTNELLQFRSRSVVARALRKLIADRTLFRAGYGVYKPSRTLTDEPYAGYKIRRFNNSSVAEDFLIKMGVDPKPGLFVRKYNEGRSTQTPQVDLGRR